MLKIDRLEFPKKYPIPNCVKLLVVLLVFTGILIHNCSQTNLTKEIQVSNVRITTYSKVHAEVEYLLTNKSAFKRDVRLLVRIFNETGEELGSALYMVQTLPYSSKPMVKIIDKLSSPLENENIPVKATLEIYRRKVI